MPITVDGISDLSRMLQQESPRTAKRWLLKVAQPAADVVIDEMKSTAPAETERLEEGIGSQSRYSDSGDGGTLLTVTIGPAWETFWGAIQEFGTQHTPALHWMARAFESCHEKCLSVFRTEAEAAILDLENTK
jgi:HK97 gp10 family phage protein